MTTAKTAAAQGTTVEPWLHPFEWFEERTGWRVLPAVSFPLAVWAIWRALSLWVSVGGGGDAVRTAYNYDGERYLQIMHYGYVNPGVEMPNTAFFPGVSWLAWPVYQVTKSNAWTAHLVASATAIAAFCAVWGVTKAWKDERIARRAVVLMALMPSSMFLWAFYSEGLFIALGAGAIWADRRGRHGIATACLFAIATTRTVGILVPAVIVLARLIHQRRIDRWAVTYAVAGAAGVLPVLQMQHTYTGDWFAFLRVQQDWGRNLSSPWETISQGYQNLWPTPETIMVPARVARNFDLYSVAIVLIAIGYLAWQSRSKRDHFPMEAWMVGVALIVLPLCSTSLASFNRFAFADWVIYPAWAAILCRCPKWIRTPAWAVIVIALLITSYAFVTRFSVDRFVG